jgi:hypothetical protein
LDLLDQLRLPKLLVLVHTVRLHFAED